MSYAETGNKLDQSIMETTSNAHHETLHELSRKTGTKILTEVFRGNMETMKQEIGRVQQRCRKGKKASSK